MPDTDKLQHVHVAWTDDREMGILMSFPQVWRWDDAYQAQNRANQMMRAKDVTIDIIYDLSATHTLPKSYFRHLRQLYDTYTDNCGMVLLVGANRVVAELIRSVTRSEKDMARRYAFVDTLEEACEVIGP